MNCFLTDFARWYFEDYSCKKRWILECEMYILIPEKGLEDSLALQEASRCWGISVPSEVFRAPGEDILIDPPLMGG